MSLQVQHRIALPSRVILGYYLFVFSLRALKAPLHLFFDCLKRKSEEQPLRRFSLQTVRPATVLCADLYTSTKEKVSVTHYAQTISGTLVYVRRLAVLLRRVVIQISSLFFFVTDRFRLM